jgi:hypothetical protein
MRLTDAGWIKLWIAVVLGTVAVHTTTLMLSPVYWIDEAQILDFGRSLVFEPETTWSFNWLGEGRPATTIGYLGPAMQEGVFRLSGLEPWAPRFASVLGGAAAATMLMGWLWARGVGGRVSVVGGVLLLLDPTLVQACRGGRVDGWAIAVALGAAWALHRARVSREHSVAFAGLSGVLTATAPFVWPTAIASLAAVGLELVQLGSDRTRPWSRSARVITAFAVAAVATGLLLGGLFVALHGGTASHGDSLWAQLMADASPALSEKAGAVIDAVSTNPALWALMLLALPVASARPFVIAAGAALVIVAPGYLYTFRFLYVIPMLAAAAAAAATAAPGAGRKAYSVLLVAALAWGTVVSLGARQAVAWSERGDRDPALMYEVATRIGRGDLAVLVAVEQFYYPGRQFGWRMFRPYPWNDQDRQVALLNRMDVAIVGEGFDERHMTEAGLALVDEVEPATPHSRYGPFKVYRRVRPPLIRE